MHVWRRLTLIGCAGMFFLCIGLILAPFLYRVGSLALARWRWAGSGDGNYTLVVSQTCYCYYTGEFELTVRNGHVVLAKSLTIPDFPLSHSAFDHLTVEAAFERAGRAVRASWLPRWYQILRVDYDPSVGYVTRFETNNLRSFDGRYLYTAREIRLGGGP